MRHNLRDIHSSSTPCLVTKPLFKLSWRNKKHSLPVRQVQEQRCLDTQAQLVCLPCAIWPLCRHWARSPVRAEGLAEVADRTWLPSSFHLLLWLGRGLPVTRLLPGSAWLSPGARLKLVLPGKGHAGCSRSTASHLLHPIINTPYYEWAGPIEVHLPLATHF